MKCRPLVMQVRGAAGQQQNGRIVRRMLRFSRIPSWNMQKHAAAHADNLRRKP